MDALKLEPPTEPKRSDAAVEAEETIKSLLEAPSLGVRVGAGLVDAVLLGGLFAAVIYLTLRVTGLQNSMADLRVHPPVDLPRLPCGCGQVGCLDTVGAARGIERLHRHFHGETLDSVAIIETWERGDARAARTVAYYGINGESYIESYPEPRHDS